MLGRARIGVVGTGYISTGLVRHLRRQTDLELSSVLTRRNKDQCAAFPMREVLTNSLAELIDRSDLIVECSGDVVHASNVVSAAFEACLPVVTMNCEFHVTVGSAFVERGYLTEAEGDQPGCLAALHGDAVQMGFHPLVYGNMKRFLNRLPTPDDMRYWARKQGISLSQVTAFTDGTKIQIEQALVANGLNADIAKPELIGVEAETLEEGMQQLTAAAANLKRPISDYVLCRNNPAGVFIVGTHDEEQQQALQYLKLGDGPYYNLTRHHHLCHLEISKTIRRTLQGHTPLLNNSIAPKVGVAAITKRPLNADTKIDCGIGGFDVRGVAWPINEMSNMVPIGLLDNARIIRSVEPDTPLMWDDVECQESLALDGWMATFGTDFSDVVPPLVPVESANNGTVRIRSAI